MGLRTEQLISLKVTITRNKSSFGVFYKPLLSTYFNFHINKIFSTSRLPLRPCLHPLQWCDSTATFLNLPPPYLFDLQDAKSLDRRGKEWDKTLRQFL